MLKTVTKSYEYKMLSVYKIRSTKYMCGCKKTNHVEKSNISQCNHKMSPINNNTTTNNNFHAELHQNIQYLCISTLFLGL